MAVPGKVQRPRHHLTHRQHYHPTREGGVGLEKAQPLLPGHGRPESTSTSTPAKEEAMCSAVIGTQVGPSRVLATWSTAPVICIIYVGLNCE